MSKFEISMKKSDVVVGKVMDETLAKELGFFIVYDRADDKNLAGIDISGDDYDAYGHCLMHFVKIGEKLHMNKYGTPTFTVTTYVYTRNDLPEEEAGISEWSDAWDYNSSYDDDESLLIKFDENEED